MISPKKHSKPNIPSSKYIKLPQINSRNRLQSSNKKIQSSDILPKIRLDSNKRKLSINKQNNFQQNQNKLIGLNKQYSLQRNVIQSRNQVQIAQNNIKHILKGFAQTIINKKNQNINQSNNFQQKIKMNRQLIKKNKHQMNFNPNKIKQNEQENQNQLKQMLKIKFISENQISLQHQNKNAQVKENMQIQNHLIINKILQKHKENLNIQHLYQQPFSLQRKQNTQRKSLKNDKKPPKPNCNKNKVFKSIQQILQNPQKLCEDREIKNRNKVKFTIQQLENQLKRLQKLQLNRSSPSDNQNKYMNQHESLIDSTDNEEIKMKSAKSVGMIPINDVNLEEIYTIRNWNKVDFNLKVYNQNQNQQHQIIKITNNQNQKIYNSHVKYHKGDFNNQMDHIQRLQMKSHKSIQKMVQNRKLLVDLKLLNSQSKNNIMPLINHELLKKQQ